MKTKIEELIESLSVLDLVRKPKNKAIAADLEAAIKTIKEEYEEHRISDNDDEKIANVVLVIFNKYPEIADDPENHRLQKFLSPPKPDLKLR